jgi:ATPase subunit of ABC transporter with duplicated ATPase domains
MSVIEVENLVKRYDDEVVVDDVTFSVEQGEIFGVLGPNGAGKTTTVESIAGLRRPRRRPDQGARARPATIEAGATGYLMKDAPRHELLRAVRAAAQGNRCCHLASRPVSSTGFVSR